MVERFVNLGDECQLDIILGYVIKDGLPIPLSKSEFGIVKLLSVKLGMLVSYHELITNTWGVYGHYEKNYLYTLINRIRNKLEDNPSKPKCLITIRGKGYILYRRIK